MARYKAPVAVIVLNNHSYNNERNRIWNGAGRQFETARDMTCYNGSPTWITPRLPARSESRARPSRSRRACRRIVRAKAATVEGRPYLLDIHIKREGLGAVSQWYPPYSIADTATPEGVIMRVSAIVCCVHF